MYFVTYMFDNISLHVPIRPFQSDIPDPVKVSLVVHHQALLRNKRCLLTYLKRRADRLEYTHSLFVESN